MKNNIIDYFKFNLMHLRVWINKQSEETEEVSRIMFNNIIDKFPDDKWFKIKKNYATYIEDQSPQWIINYTIITYKLGIIDVDGYFITDLCTVITSYEISPYNISKVAAIFITDPLYDIIIKALESKGIPPRHIIKLVLENFDINLLDRKNIQKIYELIKKFVDEYDYKIFSGNYNFFNVYHTLKRIWDYYLILELPELNFQDIELLPEFETFKNPQTKNRIQKDFAAIESKDCTIAEKFQDCLTVISHYAYDLPSYVPSKKDIKAKK